jgi:hypothetical protein
MIRRIDAAAEELRRKVEEEAVHLYDDRPPRGH